MINRRIFAILFCGVGVMPLFSQTDIGWMPDSVAVDSVRLQEPIQDTSIVQYLERTETGGRVQVVQSPRLAARIARSNNPDEALVWEDGYAHMAGFRIQVYSDNNHSRSKTEAQSREQKIKNAFPEMSTYVRFTSPFWRLRVGNFRTYEEACHAMAAIGRKFPKYRNEMRVVRERIVLKNY